MINNFTVRANYDKNELRIEMDGYFMKSEFELAFCLVKEEIKKLIPGFTILINFNNSNSSKIKNQLNIRQINNLARSMGASSVNNIGRNKHSVSNTEAIVGFYPYENEWFFY
jgi:hypothetical protein